MLQGPTGGFRLVGDIAVKSPTMFTRLLDLPERSFFLFGPRSTGKTTWLREKLPNATWFDLLDQSLYLDLLREPALLSHRLGSSSGWAVVDEVQRLPELLNEVHRVLGNSGSGVRFALTGSSARKLKRGGANLLAGRAINKRFFPLIGAELEYDFAVDDLLATGTLPNVRTEPGSAVAILEAYAANYIREEIQQEAIVKDIGSFTRFLDVAALMNGQVLNFANIARDAGVARQTVQRYFDTLEDTLIGFRLPAWKPKARVKEVAAAKFYLFDTGVARALSERIRLPLSDLERGPLLETLVLHELRAYINQADIGGELSYWRTRGGIEVDFVWTLGDKSVAIEVKATERWRPDDGRGLQHLFQEGRVSNMFGVYRGEHELKVGDILVLPVKAFMRKLQSGAIIG